MSEEDEGLSLRFDDGTLHSRMLAADPTRLVLEYTRLMMGFLLFQPVPARIAMIGLGGGSLAKYCVGTLPDVDFTAVEISPDVIAMRETFGIPPDGPRFRVRCEDGAEFVRCDIEPFDVLLVDGFDARGQSEQLCSPAFYDHCRDRLATGGVLVANLFADDGAFDRCVDRIRDSFARRIVTVAAGESANNIVFAGTEAPFPPPFRDVVARLRVLGPAHPVDLEGTARKILQYAQPSGVTRERRARKRSRSGRRFQRKLEPFVP